MPTRALLKYRNPDSTQDINDRLAGMFAKGIFEGGLITPVSGVLKIDLSAFSTVGSDGMFVKESNVTTLDVTAGVKNYIVVLQEYISNGAPILSVEVLSEAAFLITGTPGFQGSANPFMLVFGTVTLDIADTQVASSQIDYLEKDLVDQLARSSFRGMVDVPASLPSAGENINRVGDFFIVADGVAKPLIYAWDSSAWLNITDAAAVAQDLADHAGNANEDEKHLTDEQAFALVGTAGTPDGTNPYVTDADPRFPTQDQQDALAGNGPILEDSLPSGSNKYITSSKVFATPEELVAPAGTWVELGATENPAGYYVGAEGPGTAAQWFSIYASDATAPDSYINDEFLAVEVIDVQLGLANDVPNGTSLDPSGGGNGHIDSNGFFIPGPLLDATGTLYVLLSSAISAGGARVSFGTRTQLGDLLPQLFMTRGPQSPQINTNIVRLLEGTPNAQFDDATWTVGINPGQVVGWNAGTNKFVLANPVLSPDLSPVGVRGNANNLIQEGLLSINSAFPVGALYADTANPGDLTVNPNEWFLGTAMDSSRFLVNMNGIGLQSSGAVSSGVAFPNSLFDGALQAGDVCTFGPSNTFEKASPTDPTKLPVGVRGNTDTVILSGKYTALSGNPFAQGTKYYAAGLGSLSTTENDWYIGVATDTDTLLVSASGVAIPSKWTQEHDEGSGNHAFKSGDVGDRAAIVSPALGTIFIRTDTDTNFIEYWNGVSWGVATEYAVPSGSKMMFVQDAVPTGWTFDSTINDRVVIITDTLLSGGVTGGGWAITGLTADPHALSVAEMPAHQHDIIGGSGGADNVNYDSNNNGPNAATGARGIAGRPTEIAGGGGTHTHSITGDSTWRPNFVNVIICIKD
jgi:hypothetical protein